MRNDYHITAPISAGWHRVTSAALRKGRIVGTVGRELVNPKAWPEPPHVALADLDVSDPKGVRMFTARYGPLISDASQLPDAGEQFEVDLTIVAFMKQALLRSWYEKDAKQLWFPRGLELLDRYDLSLMWGTRGIEFRPSDVWTYLRLLLTRDISNGRARFCPNVTCSTPFFIAARNNRKYCGDLCKNANGSRNFRKRWPKARRRKR